MQPSSVDTIIRDFLFSLRELDPTLVEGLYLTGSIPLNDYYPGKSDIDFIVIVSRPVTIKETGKLRSIHKEIERMYGRPKLNGYYINLEELNKGERGFPSFYENHMHPARDFELDKFSLYELKTIGTTCYGIPVQELPINITIGEVIDQLHDNINSYWQRWVDRHSGLNISALLLAAFPRLTEWGVLGVARQLYTLETGQIASKLEAGFYCLEKLPEDLQSIMHIAIETRKTIKLQLKPSFKRIEETLRCMQSLIDEFNKGYLSYKTGVSITEPAPSDSSG